MAVVDHFSALRTSRPPRASVAEWRSSADAASDAEDLQQLQKTLGWISVALGVAEIAAPQQVARLIGAGDGDHSKLIRMCGARELASGVGLLSGRAPAQATLSRVAGDAIDLALLGAALSSRNANVGRLLAASAAVLGITAMDVYAARQQSALAGELEGTLDQEEPQRLTASVAVNAAPEKLYAAWRELDNLPRFMPHLESVTRLDDSRSHWVAKGANGVAIEWDARITEDEANHRLSWETLPGSPYPHRGSVVFEPLGKDRGTQVFVEWFPGEQRGMFATIVARLMGENPELRIAQGLRAFKQWIETGEVATTQGQAAGARSWLGKTMVGRES
jgi:uncharacterized membrane protein